MGMIKKRGQYRDNKTGKWVGEPWTDKQGRERWIASVVIGKRTDGSYRYRKKAFLRKKDAVKWANDLEGKRHRHETITTDKRTVAEFLQWWLDAKADGEVFTKKGESAVPRRRTIADYRDTVKKWILKPPGDVYPLGGIRLDHVGASALDELYKDMKKHTTSDRIRRLHNVVSQAFYDAVHAGTLARNPCDNARPPKRQKKRRRRRSMSMDQIKAFRAAAVNDEYSAMWHVLLLGGLRPEECLALRWHHVDLKSGTVFVDHVLVRIRGEKGTYHLEPPKTNRSRRTVPLPKAAVHELAKLKDKVAGPAEWLAQRFVFAREDGEPFYAVPRRAWVRVMGKAGIGTWSPPRSPHKLAKPQFKPAFRIYDLRHTYASLMLAKGVSLKVLSELMGHNSITMTADTYAHLIGGQQTEAVKLLDKDFRVA